MKQAFRALAALLACFWVGASMASAQSGTLPQFGHVVIVVGENANYSSTYNSSNMPYLTSLANTYGLGINYYADTHPSIGNYMVLSAGQIITNNDSQTPSSLGLSTSVDNIAYEVGKAGKTWKDYVETANGCGALNSGSYYVRHDPLQYFPNVNNLFPNTNTSSANYACFSQFATDLKNNALPNLSWLVPNGCDDAHDCSLGTFDNWLKTEIAPLLSSSYFQPGGDGLLIVVFDENASIGTSCGLTTGTGCGGQVEMVAISPYSIAGYQSSLAYEHENVLRTMAQGLGLNTTNLGAAASAAPMSDFFGATSTATVTLSPTSATLTAAVGSTATQAFTVKNGTSSSVSVTGVTLVPGTLGSEFTQTNNCSTLSASGGSCTVTVTFAPTSTGTATASLSVVTSASSTALTAALTGATSGASVSPTSLSFSTTVGTTSATQYSTLTNNGSTSLTGIALSISGPPFAFAGTGTCTSSLAAGASCTISVNFTPTTTGTFTGVVTVTDSAGTQTVSLTGTGTSTTSGGGGSTTDFYVSTTGSDSSGNGTQSSPWATIAYASTKVSAGATVHVAAGAYNGSFTTTSSGTSSAYITYVADSADFSTPVNCAQVAANHGSLSSCVQLVGTSGSTWSNNGDYVAIEGFDVTGPGLNGIYTQGTGTKIIGNHVHNMMTSTCNSTGGSGINLNGTNAQVVGNDVHNIGPYPSSCGYVQGIYFLQNGGFAYNNITFDNSGFGIQLWGTPANIALVNNTVFNNASGGITLGTDTSGFTVDYITVNNNIVFNNTGWGIIEQGASSSSTGTHNVYTDNLVYQNSSGSFSLQNGLTATGTVSANPQFVNDTGDATGNYDIQSSSPAINVGTSSDAPAYDFLNNARPQGSAWDIGSYEYMGTTSSGSLAVSPTSLTFSSTTVGSTSTAQTVTVSNSTSSAISLSSIAISGTNSSSFAETNNCGSSVAANGSCTISVTFTPSTTGTLTATLTIAPTSGSALTVSLTGSGASSTSTGPVVSLSPTSLSFGSQTVGTTSAVQYVTLTNTGSSTLTFSGSFQISGPFAFAGLGTCGSSVAAGASCTISVDFTPTTTGTFSGAVTLSDNASNSPQTIPLSGTGVSSTSGPVVSLSPTSLSFGNQTVGTTSAVQYVTLTNTGNSTLTFSGSFQISGPFAFGGTGTCGSSVAAGASCTISVDFTPTTTGTFSGAVTLSDNASNSPQTIPLSGTGVSSSTPPAVSLSPTSLNFGKQKVGTVSAPQTVTVSNTGGSSLSISGITTSAGFGWTSTCGTSLAAGASCTVSVTFAPTSMGKQTGTLALSDNAAGSPQTVSLSGSGSH